MRARKNLLAATPPRRRPPARPRIVSLFSGAGGLNLGFHQEDYKIAFAVDRMAAAINTLKRNFPRTTSVTADMESFLSLLHKNVLDRKQWGTREELRLAIVHWIEARYHRKRRQRRLGKLTPVEFETILLDAVALAA